MVENGGEISVGQRLGRIESRLETIEEHLERRITRHKEANDAAIKELATSIVKDYGERLTKVERNDYADSRVASYRKWLMGAAISLGILMLGILGLLWQVLNKVPG